MGFWDKLNGRKPCPVCEGPMDTALAINPLLCKGCETYFNLTNGSLNRVPEDYVAESPFSACPLNGVTCVMRAQGPTWRPLLI